MKKEIRAKAGKNTRQKFTARMRSQKTEWLKMECRIILRWDANRKSAVNSILY
jgi:hypothetical protein